VSTKGNGQQVGCCTRELEAAQFPEKVEAARADGAVEDVKAWELVDPEIGRYMPRRIRGSFRGRALG